MGTEPRFRLDQLVPVKTAAQSLPALVRRLERGEGPLIITKRGRPVAMLVDPPNAPRGEGL